jgi:hypothetical protein
MPSKSILGGRICCTIVSTIALLWTSWLVTNKELRMDAERFGKQFLLLVLFFGCLQTSLVRSQETVTKSDLQPAFEHRVAGRVVDSAGKPIRDALVVIQVLELGVGLSYASDRTNPEGGFELDYADLVKSMSSVPDVFLWFSSPTHEFRCVRPELLAPSRRLALEIKLRTADPKSVRVMGANANTTIEPYLVSVPNGVFESERQTGLSMIVPDIIRSALSQKLDRGGNAKLIGLSYDFPNDKVRAVTGDGLDFVLSQTVNQGFDFRIPATGNIRGHIKNFVESQSPHVYVRSALPNCESTRKCEVDSNGEFTARGLLPGQASVDLKWNPKSEWQPEPFARPTVVANETKDFEIALVRGARLSGKVRTEDTCDPVPRAKISVSCSYNVQTTGTRYDLETEGDGSFFAYLAPGEWTLQIYGIGDCDEGYGYPPNEKFTVREEEPLVDLGAIELPVLLKESGQVVDEQGRPVVDRCIAYITPELGHATRYAQTDASGKFKTRVFGVERPESVPYWVIYPVGEKRGTVDPRTLPKLKVEESNPWLLRYENGQ